MNSPWSREIPATQHRLTRKMFDAWLFRTQPALHRCGAVMGRKSVFLELFDVINDDLLGGHFGLVQTQAQLFAQGIDDSGERRFR